MAIKVAFECMYDKKEQNFIFGACKLYLCVNVNTLLGVLAHHQLKDEWF